MPICPGERSRQDFCARVTSLAFQIHIYKVLFLAQDACTSCRYFSWSLHLENARIYWQAVRGSQKWIAVHISYDIPPLHPASLPLAHTHTLSLTRLLPMLARSWGSSPPSCTPPALTPVAAALPLPCGSDACSGCLSASQGSVQNLINYLMFAKHLEDEKNCNISGKYHD